MNRRFDLPYAHTVLAQTIFAYCTRSSYMHLDLFCELIVCPHGGNTAPSRCFTRFYEGVAYNFWREIAQTLDRDENF